MKKSIIIFISIIIMLALFACSPKTYTPLEAHVAETLDAMHLKSTHDALELLKTPVQPQPTLSVAEKDERESLFGLFEVNRAVTVAESMVYDTDQVKVTVKSLGFDDSSNPQLAFSVENNTQTELSFRAIDLQLNGFMMTGAFNASVPAQSQKDIALVLDFDELEASGVETIRYFEFNLAIDESQTWSHSVTTERIHINTSAESAGALALEREGVLLMEREGIRLSLMRFESQIHSTGSRFFILAENNTDIDIQLSAVDLKVNGFALESLYSSKLLAGMKSVSEWTFEESQLAAHQIDRVNTLSFNLSVSYKDSAELLFKSDLIELNFE